MASLSAKNLWCGPNKEVSRPQKQLFQTFPNVSRPQTQTVPSISQRFSHASKGFQVPETNVSKCFQMFCMTFNFQSFIGKNSDVQGPVGTVAAGELIECGQWHCNVTTALSFSPWCS